MKLSVVVVSYESREYLDACVRSVQDADEVIVVDNDSQDGSAAWVREHHPGVTVIALEQNHGFSKAINEGVERSSGDWVLLLNPDAMLQAGQIQELRRRVSLYPDVVAFGFRQVDETGFLQLAHGGRPRLLDEFLRMCVQHCLDAHWSPAAWLVDAMFGRPRDVPWVAGSCLLVRRSAFDAVAGFDDGFFLYFEDIDFCLRLAHQDGRVLYDPTLTVIHRRGRSAKKVPTDAKRWYRESQLRFWRKHRGLVFESFFRFYQRFRSGS